MYSGNYLIPWWSVVLITAVIVTIMALINIIQMWPVREQPELKPPVRPENIGRFDWDSEEYERASKAFYEKETKKT